MKRSTKKGLVNFLGYIAAGAIGSAVAFMLSGSIDLSIIVIIVSMAGGTIQAVVEKNRQQRKDQREQEQDRENKP